jgi:hypothetical protein
LVADRGLCLRSRGLMSAVSEVEGALKAANTSRWIARSLAALRSALQQ